MANLRQTPLTCSGHTRPVVHLDFSGITESGYFLISACKGIHHFYIFIRNYVRVCVNNNLAFSPLRQGTFLGLVFIETFELTLYYILYADRLTCYYYLFFSCVFEQTYVNVEK